MASQVFLLGELFVNKQWIKETGEAGEVHYAGLGYSSLVTVDLVTYLQSIACQIPALLPSRGCPNA